MDLFQAFLNLVVPVVGLCTLLVLWPALTIRSIFLRMFHAVFEENMRGKIVLITGASSGIGEVCDIEICIKYTHTYLFTHKHTYLCTCMHECTLHTYMHVFFALL